MRIFPSILMVLTLTLWAERAEIEPFWFGSDPRRTLRGLFFFQYFRRGLTDRGADALGALIFFHN